MQEQDRQDSLLLLETIHFDLLLPERGELLLAVFHMTVDSFARDSQIAHERQYRDTISWRERVVAFRGSGREGQIGRRKWGGNAGGTRRR